MADSQLDEQIQLAREIGEELTDAFIAFIRGDVAFDDLTFGVYDALSDLHVIASGEYELEDVVAEDDEGDDEDDASTAESDDVTYDEDEATEEQEELSQEPAS
ncbi:MAG: hypothetical protein ACTHQE_03625 [Thermomicrobiales bacterium]|jgi:hypothetical protein